MGIALKPAGATPDFDVDATWAIRRLWSVAQLRSEKGGGTWDLLSVFLGRGVIPYGEGGGQVHKPSLDLSAYQLVYPGDLVLNNQQAWRGSVGVSSYRGMVSPAYVVLSLGNVLEPRFANYLFQSRVMVAQFVTSSKGVGDIQRDIHLPWLKNAKVPIPSPAQQTAIVRYLDYVGRRIRRYIRARLKLVELLEERKQAIIQRAVIRGLDANVRLTPSGIEWLGDTPQHWEVVLNQRIFREVSRPHGGMVETQLSLSQKAGLIATSEMQERSLQTSTYDNWKVTLPGDLVVNRFKAHLGVFFASTLRGIVSFHYGVFAPRRELVVKYFELLYHTNVYKTIYAGRSNGMTVGLQNLSNQNFYNVRSIVPPVSEQLGIVSFVERITERVSDRVRAVRGEIDLVREYRSRLIADVVTGRLDVREAAARLPQEMDDLGILEYTNAPLEGDEEAETEKLDADEEDRADA